MRNFKGRLLAIGTAMAFVYPSFAATNYPAALHAEDKIEQIHDRAADAVVNGRLAEALRGFNEVLKAQPFNAKAYYNRGAVHYLRRELELALHDFTAALKYRPGFAAAMMNRGVVYSNLDRLDEALRDLNMAAELDPSNSNVFFNRAVVHAKRADLGNALADYEKIVQLDGSEAEPTGARLRLEKLLGRIDDSGVDERQRARIIVQEIDHARTIEKILNFADRTCIRFGDDPSGLVELAESDGWKKASERKLTRISTPSIRVTDGWTVTSYLGNIAVILSQSVDAPYQTSCSISARLGDAHWFNELADLFTHRFQSEALIVRDLENRRIGEQVVVRADKAEVDVTVSQTTNSNFFTLRTVHGRSVHSRQSPGVLSVPPVPTEKK